MIGDRHVPPIVLSWDVIVPSARAPQIPVALPGTQATSTEPREKGQTPFAAAPSPQLSTGAKWSLTIFWLFPSVG